ncbi:MAG: LPS export ABC transporter permease LptG [Chromatiales bacterium 21-64-14]|nr:MAG: LPS export ABC transporter permease LptG [Chromatiales bacterium 21-64-14]HQU16396.1 LPS export ABC transporter permease LptG [Gammaproteobacteria bacterium]
MKLLDRYIAGKVVESVLLVLLALVVLFAFTNFLGELGDVGKGRYDLPLALIYVLLLTPRQILELFPVSALLGSVVALGLMANNNELAVIRAAGVSVARITWPVLKAGALLMFLALVLGEGLAPPAERYAHDLRVSAITGEPALRTSRGIWIRYQEGFIHIGDVVAGDALRDVTVYELDDQYQLKQTESAPQARYRNGQWVLLDVRQVIYTGDGLQVHKLRRMVGPLRLDPRQLKRLIIPPEDLSMVGLYKYVRYLERTGQNPGRYALAFWHKLSVPLVTGLMVVLAVPFVFGSLRSVTIGQRMVAAALVGIGFQLLDQTAGQVTLLYNLPPALGAFLPAGLALVLAVVLLRRVY